MIAASNGSYPKIFDRPKPARLRNAIAQFDKGEITREQLAQVEDDVTIEAIHEQIAAGVHVITDGAIRWADPITYFARGLTGVTLNGLLRYMDTNTYFRQPVADGRVEWTEPVLVKNYQFAASHSSVPVKVILPGPYTLAYSTQAPASNKTQLLQDYTRALREEVFALSAAGAPIIQIDEPLILRHKQDWGMCADAIAHIFEHCRTKRAFTTFFGSIDGGVYPRIFDLPVDILGLDFTQTARPNLNAIKGSPFPKELAAGVIDSRNTRIESVEEIVTLVQELSEVVAPEKITVCPSTSLEFVPRDTAFLKLSRCAEVAKRANEVLV